MDIIPIGFIINNLRHEIEVYDHNAEMCCSVPSNYISTSNVQNSITIKFKINGEWYESPMIHLNENSRPVKSIRSVNLPTNGYVIIEVTAKKKHLQIIVSSVIENSVRVIYFDSYFVLCNYSSHSLNFWPFCLPNNEKSEFRSIRSACYDHEDYKEIPKNTKDACDP